MGDVGADVGFLPRIGSCSAELPPLLLHWQWALEESYTVAERSSTMDLKLQQGNSRVIEVVFKGLVWSSFSVRFLQTTTATSTYSKTKKKQIGLQKTSPNRIKWKFCCNLFKPTKTGIFVVFYT